MRALTLTFFAVLGSLCLSYVPAHAVSNSGIDTPSGVTSLPLSVEGNTIVTLTNTGVGIGTATPKTSLDVNGYMRAGSATKGTHCAYEGLTAYDYGNHIPLFCNQSKVWASTAFSPSGTHCGFISISGSVSSTISTRGSSPCEGITIETGSLGPPFSPIPQYRCPSGYTYKSVVGVEDTYASGNGAGDTSYTVMYYGTCIKD